MVRSSPASSRRRAIRPPILPTPTKPILSCATLHAHFLEDFPGDPEIVHPGRNAAIDGDLQENFLNLLFADAVCECATYVELDLVRTIQGCEHRQVEHASGLLGQSWTSPDFAPTVLRDQFLQRHAEVVGILKRIVHELRT